MCSLRQLGENIHYFDVLLLRLQQHCIAVHAHNTRALPAARCTVGHGQMLAAA
jgi:hypothetical protein